MKNYLGLILFIFVSGFLIYILIHSSSSFTELFHILSTAFKTSYTTISTSSNQLPPQTSVKEKPVSKTEIKSPVVNENKSPAQPAITPPVGFTIDQLSPYYQQIRISSMYRPTSYSSAAAQITLTASYNLERPINITGWVIKTNRGELPALPRIINDYHPYGLFSEEDLVMNKNDQLYIFSGRSPISLNFRLNKCTGFLNNNYNFQPPLPNNCPTIPRNEIITLTGRCQSFIMSLNACRIPTPNQISSFGQPEESGCRTILDKINYGGCYFQHRGDVDFFSREIRIWINYPFPFDTQHDRIMLFDRDGLLVDIYVY